MFSVFYEQINDDDDDEHRIYRISIPSAVLTEIFILISYF